MTHEIDCSATFYDAERKKPMWHIFVGVSVLFEKKKKKKKKKETLSNSFRQIQWIKFCFQ